MQALARMFQPLVSWASKRYQASLAERLKDYGLRYDDLYDPQMDLVSRGKLGGRWGRSWVGTWVAVGRRLGGSLARLWEADGLLACRWQGVQREAGCSGQRLVGQWLGCDAVS